MWKLHRLYLRELCLTLLPTLVVLFGVVLLASAARGIQEAQGATLWQALKVTVFWASDALAHLLGIGFLLATVATFSRAAASRELTAVQAAGISLRVPMQSAIAVGLLLSLLMGFVLHWVAPQTHFHKHRILAESVRVILTRTGLQGDSLRLGDKMLMTWERQTDNRFEDLVLFVGGDSPSLGSLAASDGLLIADRASFGVSDDGLSLVCDFFELRDPVRPDTKVERFRVSQPIEDFGGAPRRESDRDLASDQLVAELDRGVHPFPDSAEFALNRRTSFALLPLLMAPIGFALGVLARDHGRALGMALCAVPLALFYGADFLGMRLTRAIEEPLFAFSPVLACVVFWFYPCGRILRR